MEDRLKKLKEMRGEVDFNTATAETTTAPATDRLERLRQMRGITDTAPQPQVTPQTQPQPPSMSFPEKTTIGAGLFGMGTLKTVASTLGAVETVLKKAISATTKQPTFDTGSNISKLNLFKGEEKENVISKEIQKFVDSPNLFEEGFSKPADKFFETVPQLQGKDLTYWQQVVTAGGSSLPFFVGGMIGAKSKLNAFTLNIAMSGTEAMINGYEDYKTLVEQDDKNAGAKALASFGANLALNYVTNKLGFLSSVGKAEKMTIPLVLKKFFATTLLETNQEVMQDFISGIATGADPQTMLKNMAHTGLVSLPISGVFGIGSIAMIKPEIQQRKNKEFLEGVAKEGATRSDVIQAMETLSGNSREAVTENINEILLEEKGIAEMFEENERRQLDEIVSLLNKEEVVDEAMFKREEGETQVPELTQSIKQAKASGQSFDEWVKGQGELVYHGGDKIQTIDPNKSNYAKTFFVTDNADYAKGYVGKGQVLNDIYLKPNTKLIDVRNAPEDVIAKIRELGEGKETGKIIDIKKPDGTILKIPERVGGVGGFGNLSFNETLDGAIRGKSHYAEDLNLVEIYKKLGYDGMVSYEDVGMRGKNIGIWNKDVIKTRSQLKAEWDKVAVDEAMFKREEGETDNLTTKILKDLEGRETVSKQYILDATNRPELKQQERELIRQLVEAEGDVVNVADFTRKVQAELLPLKVKGGEVMNVETAMKKIKEAEKRGDWTEAERLTEIMERSDLDGGTKYENIALPDELRGNIKNYRENIYESPIKTSAGDTHFRGVDNYFGHTRIEDMADNTTRRVIEVQSDLYQKGNLERELGSVADIQKQADPHFILNGEKVTEKTKLKKGQFVQQPNDRYTQWKIEKIDYDSDPNYIMGYAQKYDTESTPRLIPNRGQELILAKKQKAIDDVMSQADKRRAEIKKLEQYNNPTAHFRMVREEIKKAAQDGIKKMQFPTGETAMKIEGLGETAQWTKLETDSEGLFGYKAEPDNIKVGDTIIRSGINIHSEGSYWIITDVLGDGKFKAVPKDKVRNVTDKLDLYRELTDIQYEPSFYKNDSLIEKAVDDIEFGEMMPDDLFSKYDWKDLRNRFEKIEIQQLNESNLVEQFDISGKVDTNNPIYKFYEKELARYLKSKYDTKLVTDEQGVSWFEVQITEDMGGPVEAFQKDTADEQGRLPYTYAVDKIKEYQERLGVDFPVSVYNKIFTGELEAGSPVTAFGMYLDGSITFAEMVTEFTADHEMLHFAFRNMQDMSVFQGLSQEVIFAELRSKYGDLSKIELEERLAVDFENYVKQRETKKTTTFTGKVKSFFDRLYKALKDLLTLNTKEWNAIDRFYHQLYFGKNSEVISFENTNASSEFMKTRAEQFGDVVPLFKKVPFSEVKKEFTKGFKTGRVTQGGIQDIKVKKIKRENELKTLKDRITKRAYTEQTLNALRENLPRYEWGRFMTRLTKIGDSETKFNNLLSDIYERATEISVENGELKANAKKRSQIGFLKKVFDIEPSLVLSIKRDLGYDKSIRNLDGVQLDAVIAELKSRILFRKNNPEKYLALAEVDKKKNLWDRIKSFDENFIAPIERKVQKISKPIYESIMTVFFDTNMRNEQSKEKLEPMLKVFEKMTKDDKVLFTQATQSAQKEKSLAILEQYVSQEEANEMLDNAREVLDGVYKELKDVDVDVPYRSFFFPRQMKPLKLDQAELVVNNLEYKEGRKLTVEEKQVLLNKLQRGFSSGSMPFITLSGKRFEAHRLIETVPLDLIDYYEPFDTALINYVMSANSLIEERKFFGKTLVESMDYDANLSLSIGAKVQELRDAGLIDKKQMEELQDSLQVLFATRLGKFDRSMMQFTSDYVYPLALGQIGSTITQVKDLSMQILKDLMVGQFNMIGGMKIKPQDVGLSDSIVELETSVKESKSKFATFLKKTLTPFSATDNFFLTVYLNASFRRLQKLAKSSNKNLITNLNNIFGEAKANEVMGDLIAGEFNQDVARILFGEVAEIRPITKLQKARGATRSPLWYTLRNFSIKQLQFVRSNSFDIINKGIQEKDAKKVAEGMGKLVMLMTVIGMLGAGVDQLKDFIRGRDPEEFMDDYVDNLIQMIGLNNYMIVMSKQRGFGNQLWTSYVPAAGSITAQVATDVVKDINAVIDGDEISKMRTIKKIPLIGDIIYNRLN